MFLSERKRIIECKRFQSYTTSALFIRNSTHFFYSVRVRQDERKKPSLGTRIFAFFHILILYEVSPFHGLLSLCNSLYYSSFCSTCTVEYDFLFCCVFFYWCEASTTRWITPTREKISLVKNSTNQKLEIRKTPL
jgi:hypothetical protein